MHKIVFFPILLKIFRPVTQTHLFFIWPQQTLQARGGHCNVVTLTYRSIFLCSYSDSCECQILDSSCPLQILRAGTVTGDLDLKGYVH